MISWLRCPNPVSVAHISLSAAGMACMGGESLWQQRKNSQGRAVCTLLCLHDTEPSMCRVCTTLAIAWSGTFSRCPPVNSVCGLAVPLASPTPHESRRPCPGCAKGWLRFLWDGVAMSAQVPCSSLSLSLSLVRRDDTQRAAPRHRKDHGRHAASLHPPTSSSLSSSSACENNA